MAKRLVLTAILGGFLALGLAAPAMAQDVDRLERITGTGPTPGGGFRAPEGVKVVSSGALVFASFDRNFDGRITADEIAAGAEGAFAAADRNQDGKLTGFEQTDWAGVVNSSNDILANAMTFDVDLDRVITKAEFAAGMKRLAGQLMTQPNTELTYADLLKPLSRGGEEQAGGPGFGLGTITGRGSPPGGVPAGGNRNVSPGVTGN